MLFLGYSYANIGPTWPEGSPDLWWTHRTLNLSTQCTCHQRWECRPSNWCSGSRLWLLVEDFICKPHPPFPPWRCPWGENVKKHTQKVYVAIKTTVNLHRNNRKKNYVLTFNEGWMTRNTDSSLLAIQMIESELQIGAKSTKNLIKQKCTYVIMFAENFYISF